MEELMKQNDLKMQEIKEALLVKQEDEEDDQESSYYSDDSETRIKRFV
jgi:hypothetical protein